MRRRPTRSSAPVNGDLPGLNGEGRLHLIEELSILASQSPDPVLACRALVLAVRQSTGADYVGVEGVRDGEATLQCRVTRGRLRQGVVADRIAPLVKGVLKTGKAVTCQASSRSAACRRLRTLGFAGLVVVPIRSRRSVVGALCIGSRRPFRTDARMQRFYRAVASHAALLIGQLRGSHQLRSAVASYDSLFRGVLDAILMVDPGDGEIIDANPQAARLTGYTHDELLRLKIFALHPPGDHPRHRAMLTRLRSGGPVTRYGPVSVIRKNGKLAPIEVTASHLTIADRGVVVCILRDLSEQKRAEVKLAASEELLRIIVEGTLDMFFYVHDPKGAFTYLSPSVERITGFPPEHWKTRYKKFLTANPINELVKEYTERALREGIASPAYLCEVLHADGRPLLLEINEKPILKDGRVIGVQGVARDITEKKRLEEAILESRDNLNRILDQTPIAVMVMDVRGNLMDANEAWLHLFGAADKESVVGGLNVLTSAFIRRAGLAEAFAEVYKGEIVDIPSITIDPRQANPELPLAGVERSVHVRLFPVTDRAERLVNVVAMIEDVTDKRRLEEQLIQSQKMESIGLLAGGIAHDFNNILGGILGYASFVKGQISKEDKIFPHLETIERSALRAAELTSQLLAFARGGKYVVAPMFINGLVKETAELLRGTIERNVALETHLDPSAPVIEADGSQMQQVLMNLGVNARDAMPGGGTLTLSTARLNQPDAYLRTISEARGIPFVRIDIADSGVGIDKAIRGKIFDPFFTTKEKGKGTGLGLATVYGIVKNHGGYINVESDVGVGTTFSIYIPAVEKRAPAPIAVPPRAVGGRETILVVDDEEMIRMLVRDILQEKGYAVIGAGDGYEAERVYRERGRSIDLVILDMTMPGMSGRETFEKLRDINPDIRAILSTGYAKDERAREVLALGVKAFVQKPYKVDDLAAAVRRVLDSST